MERGHDRSGRHPHGGHDDSPVSGQHCLQRDRRNWVRRVPLAHIFVLHAFKPVNLRGQPRTSFSFSAVLNMWRGTRGEVK